MTDIINLNSIRSNNCDCNKPKKTECGCQHDHKPQQDCVKAIDLNDQFFKVKNLFGELKSEWQRTEARSNLGIVDIIDLRQTKESDEPGGVNEWMLVTSTGGRQKKYYFYVKNGYNGKNVEIERWGDISVGQVEQVKYTEPLKIWRTGTGKDAIFNFHIPEGKPGDKGDAGKSAYQLYCDQGGTLPLDEWLLSLKGKDGKDGEQGEKGNDAKEVKKIELTGYEEAYMNLPGNLKYNGKIGRWTITMNDDSTLEFWVPFSGGNGTVEPVGTPTFMYKKINKPNATEESLASELSILSQQCNVSSLQGKTVEQLESLGWQKIAPVVGADDYLFMATTVISSQEIKPWSIVRLTSIPGKGTPGTGTRGDFKSIAFIRIGFDISRIQPTGGTYDNPIPNSIIMDDTIDRYWSDGIPEGNAMLWATTRIFHGDGTPSEWTYPRKMMDDQYYDVEFSPNNTCPNDPSNKEEDRNAQGWYDPIRDANKNIDWTSMIWRAEREHHNDVWSPWVKTRIKGEKGDSGSGGGQGLLGPVIRMRGEWQSNETYHNDSAIQQEEDTLRYIDIVYHNGSYWMLKLSVVGPTGEATLTTEPGSAGDIYWKEAQGIDFAYIGTLIAEYLNVYSIDTDEIRIHNRSINDSNQQIDSIVAGMTSGGKTDDEANITYTNDQADPVRIWAGSNIGTGLVGVSYNLNNAPFIVRQSGALEASKAKIEGTVQANTLRLGQLNNGNGSFICPDNNTAITLPELTSGKVQMFYLLTNKDTLTGNITINANGNDLIQVVGQVAAHSFSAKRYKLYQLFGIDTTWYVVEQDLTAYSSYVEPDPITCKIGVLVTDKWDPPQTTENGVGNWILQTQNVGGTANIAITNHTDEQKNITIPNFTVKVSYLGTYNLEPNTNTINANNLNPLHYTITFSLGTLSIPANTTQRIPIAYYMGTINEQLQQPQVAVTTMSSNGSNPPSIQSTSTPIISQIEPTPASIGIVGDGPNGFKISNIPMTLHTIQQIN